MSLTALVRRATAVAGALLAVTTFARAQQPRLLTSVTNAPAAAVAWEAQERARSPMVVQSAFVRVDTTILANLPPGGPAPLGSLAVDLFGDVVTIEITSRDWRLDQQVFRGRVANTGKPSEVHVVLSPTGVVWAAIDIDSAQWVVAHTGVGDVHVLQSIDPSRLPPHMRCGTGKDHEVAAPAFASLVATSNSNCSLTTIDVLVLYTSAARQNAGGVAAIETAITGAISQANEAHLGSGVPVEFRLVHLAETSYAELGTGTDLSRLRNDSDGFMDEAHTLRTTYGADLVHLITDPASAAYCGIAYLMTNLSTGFASSAFAVTVRGCIPNRTFTHESGHNLGCAHDAANAGAALFPYSYGYRTPDNAYRTIMAYAPGTRINRWSSPNVTHLGYTMGVAGEADNALSITNSCSTVAQFLATQAPVWCQLGGGIPSAIGEPVLTGSGTMNLADPLSLTVRNYTPNTLGILIVGASAIDLPISGGLIVPSLDVLSLLVGPGADLVQSASWLTTLPVGFQVWAQAVFLDATAAQGLAASDGVKVTVP